MRLAYATCSSRFKVSWRAVQIVPAVQPLRSVQIVNGRPVLPIERCLGRLAEPSFTSFSKASSFWTLGRSGLYSYRFDSETVRSSGCTLTVVGRNE